MFETKVYFFSVLASVLFPLSKFQLVGGVGSVVYKGQLLCWIHYQNEYDFKEFYTAPNADDLYTILFLSVEQ